MAGSSSASRLSSAALWLSESSSGNTMVPPGFIRSCVVKKIKAKSSPPFKKETFARRKKLLEKSVTEQKNNTSLRPRSGAGGVAHGPEWFRQIGPIKLTWICAAERRFRFPSGCYPEGRDVPDACGAGGRERRGRR